MIERAREEYLRALRVPLGSLERHHNRLYMCFLRDFIADHEGRDAETVQDEYEAAAAESNKSS
jgi:hypothetical protein